MKLFFVKQQSIWSLEKINQSSPEEVNNYLKKRGFSFSESLGNDFFTNMLLNYLKSNTSLGAVKGKSRKTSISSVVDTTPLQDAGLTTRLMTQIDGDHAILNRAFRAIGPTILGLGALGGYAGRLLMGDDIQDLQNQDFKTMKTLYGTGLASLGLASLTEPVFELTDKLNYAISSAKAIDEKMTTFYNE